jgi:hypothetical protein
VRQERRDLRQRADTTRRVMIWICGETSAVAEVPRYLAAPDVGRRILRQLALRGLVRRADGGWVARRWLLAPPALEKLPPGES